MREEKKLAIVIPAYKATFLSATLDSIAAQTCKNFTLYVGDDCSPNNIKKIVDRYIDKIDVVYHRFETNLGSKDLVAQWERCIDMIHDEKWIWLFSDDDVMDKNCVEEFYKMANNSTSFYFHFNIRQIDTNGLIQKNFAKFPNHISAVEYLEAKTDGLLFSFVVEFIFERNFFFEAGRFENFDMAWGSDYITTLKLANLNNGIETIQNAMISWRSSEENISPNKSARILKRKMISVVQNLLWIKNFINDKTSLKYSIRYYKYFFGEMIRIKNLLDRKSGNEIIRYFGNEMSLNLLSNIFKIYWNLIKL